MIDLFERPAPETARRIAREFLDQSVAACERLVAGGDPDALHDFRVALRRLRSCERAYHEVLRDSVKKKDRKRLARLARATGTSRDAEVHLEWLESQRGTLTPRQERGRKWLAARIARDKPDADAALRDAIARDFEKLRAGFGRALGVYHLTVRLDADDAATTPLTGGQFTAAMLSHLSEDLRRRLERLHESTQEKRAHAARIAAKRLRYALEPVADLDERAQPVVQQLRELQDELGDLHDVHVFAGELADAMEDAAADEARAVADVVREGARPLPARRSSAGPRAGLIELAQRLHARGEHAFSQVESRWLNGAADHFFDDVKSVASRLAYRLPDFDDDTTEMMVPEEQIGIR